MRFFVFLVVCMSFAVSGMAQFHVDEFIIPNIDVEQCEWVWSNSVPEERIALSGNVYVAKEGEPYDLKIRVARKGETPDMWVGIVKKYPDECGMWMWVNDRKMAALVVKFVSKVGEENLIVKFVDGEKRRHNTDLPCYDWSSGKPEPCK